MSTIDGPASTGTPRDTVDSGGELDLTPRRDGSRRRLGFGIVVAAVLGIALLVFFGGAGRFDEDLREAAAAAEASRIAAYSVSVAAYADLVAAQVDVQTTYADFDAAHSVYFFAEIGSLAEATALAASGGAARATAQASIVASRAALASGEALAAAHDADAAEADAYVAYFNDEEPARAAATAAFVEMAAAAREAARAALASGEALAASYDADADAYNAYARFAQSSSVDDTAVTAAWGAATYANSVSAEADVALAQATNRFVAAQKSAFDAAGAVDV